MDVILIFRSLGLEADFPIQAVTLLVQLRFQISNIRLLQAGCLQSDLDGLILGNRRLYSLGGRRLLVFLFSLTLDDRAILSVDVIIIFRSLGLEADFPIQAATLLVQFRFQIGDAVLGQAGFLQSDLDGTLSGNDLLLLRLGLRCGRLGRRHGFRCSRLLFFNLCHFYGAVAGVDAVGIFLLLGFDLYFPNSFILFLIQLRLYLGDRVLADAGFLQSERNCLLFGNSLIGLLYRLCRGLRLRLCRCGGCGLLCGC